MVARITVKSYITTQQSIACQQPATGFDLIGSHQAGVKDKRGFI